MKYTNVVGLMWNYNEGDILHFTISKALENVDYLLLADDSSTDNSFEIMRSFSGHPKVLHVEQVPRNIEKKQHLLNIVKSKFDYTDTLVQVIESDITILDTDIRTTWDLYNNNNASMSWHLLNATDPEGWQNEDGCYPNWTVPVDKKMANGYWVEELSHYTFRPLPGVEFVFDGRPWPRGLARYVSENNMRTYSDAPLLAHWGHRGPSHAYKKYSTGPGSVHRKYRWKMGSIEECKLTVPFYNGIWNNQKEQFPLSRAGWTAYIKKTWNRD